MSPDSLQVRPTRAGVRIDLRVTPRASTTGLAGVRGGRLLVKVTAPPVDDAANQAVVRVLAAALDVPTRAVRIVAGGAGRNKSVEVAGLDVAEAGRRLHRVR